MPTDCEEPLTTSYILHNLLEVFNLVLKKNHSSQKMCHDVYHFQRNVFYQKSLNLSVKSVGLINSCLLNHHFHEAAKLLWVICQDRICFDLFFYKAMMVVLENLQPNTVNEFVMQLSSNVQDQRYIHKLDIQLEYLIYALKKHIPELDATYKKVKEKRRKVSLKKITCVNSILTGYTALLNYISWRASCQGGASSSQEKNAADTAIGSLKHILNEPGTWDIFLLKLIEILNYYDKYDEIEDVLKKYVELNPEHANAYIYICVYLHKNNTNEKAFIHYSKELVKLCPSDVRVLLLVQKWKILGKHLKKRLRILFIFLDYPANGRNILGWKMLFSHLSEALTRKKSSSLDIIRSLWSMRSSFWNLMHFNSSNSCSASKDEFQLLIHKIAVLSKLDSGHDYIKEILQKYPTLHNFKLGNGAETMLEDFNSLYKFDNETVIGELL